MSQKCLCIVIGKRGVYNSIVCYQSVTGSWRTPSLGISNLSLSPPLYPALKPSGLSQRSTQRLFQYSKTNLLYLVTPKQTGFLLSHDNLFKHQCNTVLIMFLCLPWVRTLLQSVLEIKVLLLIKAQMNASQFYPADDRNIRVNK